MKRKVYAALWNPWFFTAALAAFSLSESRSQVSLDNFNPAIRGEVFAIAVQPDGRILVGGAFVSVGPVFRSCLARLNSDGSIDTTFDPGPGSYLPEVYAITVQQDGRILVGFESVRNMDGSFGSPPARLFSDGSWDSSFDPRPTRMNPDSIAGIYEFAIQGDGKIIAAGAFDSIAGSPRDGIARFNPDGSVDSSFVGWVYAGSRVTLQPDGKILIGGLVLSRLNPDGSPDATFKGSASAWIWSIRVQPDGKILVGGSYTALNGQPRTGLGRLNADGTLDESFNPVLNNAQVASLAVQPDGKILVGGVFTKVGEYASTNLVRLNPNGSVDTTFGGVRPIDASPIALQADGKILTGGVALADPNSPESSLHRLSVPPASPLLVLHPLGPGTVTFRYSNPGGTPYVVVASTNVTSPWSQWNMMGLPQSVAPGIFQFSAPTAPGRSQFYSLRSQ